MTHQDQWTELDPMIDPGCEAMLVCRHHPSGSYGPALAFLDVGKTWRVVGSPGGMAPLAWMPTHWRPVPSIWEAALADREQPGTDDGNAGGSEQKSLSGEAVAWRYRMRGPFIRPDRTAPGPWTMTRDGTFSERFLEQYEVQPLYAAPSSQGREGV